jgi:hypothetical protein
MTSKSSQPSLIFWRNSVPTKSAPGFLGFLDLGAGGDDEHPHRLARTGRQHDGATHHLVGVTRVDAEADRDFDRLVELRERHLLDQRDRLLGLIRLAEFAALTRGAILLPVRLHEAQSFTVMPMERAAPAIIATALSMVTVEVGHLRRRDLLELRPRDRADLHLVRLTRALVHADLLLDELRRRRSLQNEGERLVRVDRDLDRDDHITALRPSIELFAEAHDVDTLGTEGRTHRGRRVRLACRNLQLDESSDLLGHATSSSQVPPTDHPPAVVLPRFVSRRVVTTPCVGTQYPRNCR